MIISEIKKYIKYGGINQSFVGKWYKGLSDGTIKILTNKGYIIKRSAEHCDEFAVLLLMRMMLEYRMNTIFQRNKI